MGAEINSIEQMETINRRAEATEEILQKIVLEGDDSEGVFSALGMLVTDAILDEDVQTLHVVHNYSSLSMSPAIGRSEEVKSKMSVFAEFAQWGMIRRIPVPNQAELTYLQLADGRGYHKDKTAEEFTREESWLIDTGLMVCSGFFMRLTPKGAEALDKSRLVIEKRA